MNNKKLSQGKTQFERARIIKRTLGTRVAARYMALRGWSIECALFVLCGSEGVK